MKKYQVTIQFTMDEVFMSHVPKHRAYINSLINKNIIEHYAVSIESMECWIIVNARDKKQVEKYLEKSTLHKYWVFQIHELFVYDSSSYRLPELMYN